MGVRRDPDNPNIYYDAEGSRLLLSELPLGLRNLVLWALKKSEKQRLKNQQKAASSEQHVSKHRRLTACCIVHWLIILLLL